MFSLQMRAVLVDWLEEVQVQFKLLQVKCTSYQSISQGDLTTTILMFCVTGDSVQHHLYRRPVPCRGGALGHEVQAAAGGRGRHVPGLQGGRSLRASMLYPLLAPVLQGWRRGRAAAQPGQVRHRARPRRERPFASARVPSWTPLSFACLMLLEPKVSVQHTFYYHRSGRAYKRKSSGGGAALAAALQERRSRGEKFLKL